MPVHRTTLSVLSGFAGALTYALITGDIPLTEYVGTVFVAVLVILSVEYVFQHRVG
jgi:hypothetical protein